METVRKAFGAFNKIEKTFSDALEKFSLKI